MTASIWAALCALFMCLSAVLVRHSRANLLWMLAARAVCDTGLSTAALLWLKYHGRERAAGCGGGTKDKGSPVPEIHAPSDSIQPPPASAVSVVFRLDDVALHARGVCYFAFVLGWYASLIYLPVGVAIAVNYSQPAITVPLCGLVLGEAIPREFWFEFALLIAGVALVARPWDGEAGDDGDGGARPALGLAFALAAVCAIAIVTVLTRCTRARHVLHVQQAAGATACALVPAGFAALAWGAPGALAPPPAGGALLELFVIGAVTFAGLCCWKLANDAAPTAASVTLVFALEVPMGLAAQWACFGERPAAADGAGAALILLATCLPEKWMARLVRPAATAAKLGHTPMAPSSGSVLV